MGFLTGKKLLITGVLSNRSIAYGIAKACHQQGAELAFSYVGERFKDRITDFAAEFEQLQPLQEMGLVEVNAQEIQVTATGWFFVRAVAIFEE